MNKQRNPPYQSISSITVSKVNHDAKPNLQSDMRSTKIPCRVVNRARPCRRIGLCSVGSASSPEAPSNFWDFILKLDRGQQDTMMGIFVMSLIGTVIVLAVWFVQSRKGRQHELDILFKQELLERGLTVNEIERLLRIKSFDGAKQPDGPTIQNAAFTYQEPAKQAGAPPPHIEPPSPGSRTLMRNTKKAQFGGICAGLADYLAVDVGFVRVVYVIAAFMTAIFPMVIGYIILLFVMPRDDGLSPSGART